MGPTLSVTLRPISKFGYLSLRSNTRVMEDEEIRISFWTRKEGGRFIYVGKVQIKLV